MSESKELTSDGTDVELVNSLEPILAYVLEEKLMPVLLSLLVVALLKTPTFCWNALGVPLNQCKMMLNDNGIYELVRDTLGPIPSTYSLEDGAYFYSLVRS